MYEISKRIRGVEGVDFVTYSRNVYDLPYEIEVEAGSTTTFSSNREAISYIRIKNINGVKFKVKPLNMNGSDGVEIVVIGNSGLRLLLIGLKFIRKVIIDCMKGKIF